MRIFKRETNAFWVDIYFFGGKAADAFRPDELRGTLRWSRIGPTQVQVLTTHHRELEASAVAHEKSMLELLRQERLEHLASLAVAQAEAKTSTSPGGEFVESKAVEEKSPRAASTKKPGGCRGCGKK